MTLRRSPMPRRRSHADPVSPELRIAVLERDGGCVAVRLGEDPASCSGRLTLDHVKGDPRMGVRAPSDMAHLVALCEGHTESGARAGRQWNTANRPLLRRYIEEANRAE